MSHNSRRRPWTVHASVNCIDNSCHGNYTLKVKNLDSKNIYDLKSNRSPEEFVPLVMRVRMAIIQALDQEFLRDNCLLYTSRCV